MDGERVYITPKAGEYFGQVQMILEKGNMWSVFGKTDYFYITTNPIRRKDGGVVMGRGIAKEAKERFPRLPYDFGQQLRYLEYPDYTPDKFRHVGIIDIYDGQRVGYFMVKHHWNAEAQVSIIQNSVSELIAWHTYRDGSGRFADVRVDLNFPGIGNGKLKREDVLPIIEQLPDNVHVWEYE